MDLYGLYYTGEDEEYLHAISVSIETLNKLKDENVSLEELTNYTIRKVKMKRAINYFTVYSSETEEQKLTREKNAEFLKGKRPYKIIVNKKYFKDLRCGETKDINDLLIEFNGIDEEYVVHESLKSIREDKSDKTKFEYFIGLTKNTCENRDEFPYYAINVIVEICPIDKYVIYKHGIDSMYTACYSDLFKLKGRYEDISDFSKVLNLNGIYCSCDKTLDNGLLIFAMESPEVTREEIINEYYPKFKNNNLGLNPLDLDVFYPEGAMNA